MKKIVELYDRLAIWLCSWRADRWLHFIVAEILCFAICALCGGLPGYDRGGTTPMVDVVLQDGRSYAIPETVGTAYTGNLAISLTLDGALAEVKSASEKAKQELARTESNKELIDKCAKIAEELNPVLKEKAETERRFASIEKGMSDIAQKVGELLNKLT